MALRRIGVERFGSWKVDSRPGVKQGFPVSQFPEIPEVAAERVGVKLPPHDLLETEA